MTQAKCNGKIIFSPLRPGLKKVHRAFDSGIILKVDNGISDYYSWWLEKRGNVFNLSRPAWGTHITVVSDRDKVKDLQTFKQLQQEFNGKILSVPYDVRLKKVWQFWVLDVIPTKEMQHIRQSLGLKLDFPFHITIGRDDHV